MNNQDKYTFVLLNENSKPTIKGRKFPYNKLIPAFDEIWDADKQETRLIQLSKKERTIYVDEFKSESSADKRESILFSNGFKIVDAKETKLLEFMRASNFNKDCADPVKGSTPIYYEYVPGKAEKEVMAKDLEVMDAKQAAFNLKLKDMIAYARVLGIDTNKEVDEIRWNLSIIAAKNPKSFMAGLNSPNTKRANNVLEAIDKNILIKDDSTRAIKWANNNVAILTAPVKQDVVSFFVEWTFGTKDGEDVYAAILDQLRSGSDSVFIETEEDDVEALSEVELVEKAIEAEIITKAAGGVLVFKDKKLRKGVNPTAKLVESNSELKTALLMALAD